MWITQGTFSFLPPLTDAQISAQVDYALRQGWALSVEYTDDAHPRNTYWEMWGMPMFDVHDAAAVLFEMNACRRSHPEKYIKVNAFDATQGVESLRLSFIVNRPSREPGFDLTRAEGAGRNIRYTMQSRAIAKTPGEEGR